MGIINNNNPKQNPTIDIFICTLSYDMNDYLSLPIYRNNAK